MQNPEKYIAIICFIAGTCLVFYVLWVFYFHKVIIKKWSKTEGFIVDNKISYYDKSGDTGWFNEISYKYSINGLDFINDKFSKNIILIHCFKDNVKINKNYTIGESVTVFYNPKKIKDSIIEANFDYYNFATLLFCVIIFWIGISLW